MTGLPLFMTRANKYRVGWSVFAYGAAMYLLTNHVHIIQPIELGRTWIDLSVPFIPETVWIYLSEYLFFAAIYITSDNHANLNKYIYAFLAVQTSSCLIFWFWPTTYPRGLFPLPADLDWVTKYLFSNLRETDSPANCCPSLHVSCVYLSSFVYIDEKRKLFPVYFLWATAIALSTLTTKQHYLVDVIAGMIVAGAAYWIFFRKVHYQRAVFSNNSGNAQSA